MKLLRYGIITGALVFILFLSSALFFAREGSRFLRRVYADEAVSSASIDALSLNEDIYAKADPLKAISLFYKSMECFGSLPYGAALVMFLSDDGIYYCGTGEEPKKKEYTEKGIDKDAEDLILGMYSADLFEKPYILYKSSIEKRSFIVVWDEAGKMRASIGGAVRKRKKGNEWNNR